MKGFEQDFEIGVATKLYLNFKAWLPKFPQSAMTGAAYHSERFHILCEEIAKNTPQMITKIKYKL